MPTFQITGPDGKKYRVKAPEGATADDALAQVRAQSESKFPATVTAMKGVAQGVGGIVDLATMFPRKLIAAGARGIDRLAGGGTPAADYARLYEDGISGTLDRAIPTPANQRTLRSVFEGVGGAATGAGVAGGIARSGGGVLARALAANPVSQAVAGGAGGGAAETVRQAGGNVPMQIGAGVAAGMLAPGSLETAFARNAPAFARARGAAPAIAGLGGDMVSAATGRLTDRSVREAAAQVLRENATDAAAAAAALRRGRPAASSAAPTVAEVSRDPGLAGLQRSLGNLTNSGLKTRLDNNTVARQQAMQSIGGPGDAEALRPALEAERKAARARAGKLYDFDGKDEFVEIGAPPPNDMRSPNPPDEGRVAFEADGRAAMKPAPAGPRVPGLFSLIAKRGVNPNGQLAADLKAVGISNRTNPGLFRKSGGVTSADELVTPAREAGFIKWDGDGADDFGANDLFDLLVEDMRATGKGATGSRVQNADALASRARMDAQDAQRNSMLWQRTLDERGLDPERMDTSDWDALFRDTQGLGPRPVTQDDMRFLSEGAEAAGPAVLSPFQSSILELRKRMFPGNVGVNGNVTALLDRLMKAETVTVGEAMELGKALRRQAGQLNVSDGSSAALAKAAANALEGHISAQAGPALVGQMRQARAGWRDVKATFDEGAAGRVLARNRFGGDVRRVSDSAQVAQAFAANDKGKALRELVKASGGNAEAKGALRRSAAEYVVSDGAAANVSVVGDDVQSNLKLYQRLDRVLSKSEMTGLWSPQQRRALKLLRDEFQGAQFAASAERAAGSNTSRDAMAMSRIARRTLNAALPGKASVMADLLNMFDRADEVAAMTAKAMLDPKFAADLLEAPTPERLAAARNSLAIGSGGAVGAASAAGPRERYSPATM